MENKKWCGRKVNVAKESRRERPSVFLPEAFSMIALSIAVITGATRAPAVAAEVTSAPSRILRFCVFQCVVFGVVVVLVSVLRFGRDAPGPAAALIAS